MSRVLTRELLLALNVECSVCNAQPGEGCRPFSLTHPHRDRVNRARETFNLESALRGADLHARRESLGGAPGHPSGDAA